MSALPIVVRRLTVCSPPPRQAVPPLVTPWLYVALVELCVDYACELYVPPLIFLMDYACVRIVNCG
jgi:hypothetical protein